MLGEQYRVKSDTGSNTAAQVKLMNMRKPSGNHSSEKTKAETQKKEDGQREAKPKIKLSELILHLDTLQKKIYSKTRDSAEAGKPKLNSLINNWRLECHCANVGSSAEISGEDFKEWISASNSNYNICFIFTMI